MNGPTFAFRLRPVVDRGGLSKPRVETFTEYKGGYSPVWTCFYWRDSSPEKEHCSM